MVSAWGFQPEGQWFKPGLCHYVSSLDKKLCSTSLSFSINLTQARDFIDRFNHNFQTKTYTFHVSILLNSISDKITAKSIILFPK